MPTARPCRSSIVSAVRTLATGHPVTATSSSTVARPRTISRPRRPATSPTPDERRRDVDRHAALDEPIGETQIVDELRDPRHDPASAPGTRAGTRGSRQTAGASIGPGTRKHSRPCSSAQDAVMRAPLLAGASTTTVASARPLTTRFRRGNVPGLGGCPGASSETMAPPAPTIESASLAGRAGGGAACPDPMTATVVPPAWTAAA